MDVTLLHFICEKGDFTVARYGVRGAIFQSPYMGDFTVAPYRSGIIAWTSRRRSNLRTPPVTGRILKTASA